MTEEQIFEKIIFHIDKILECYGENILLDASNIDLIESFLKVRINDIKEDILSLNIKSSYYK